MVPRKRESNALPGAWSAREVGNFSRARQHTHPSTRHHQRIPSEPDAVLHTGGGPLRQGFFREQNRYEQLAGMNPKEAPLSQLFDFSLLQPLIKEGR